MKVLAGSVVAAGLLVGAAPMAHADEQSYVEYVRSHDATWYPDANLISGGWDICSRLKSGQSIESIRQSLWGGIPDSAIYGAPIELCPR